MLNMESSPVPAPRSLNCPRPHELTATMQPTSPMRLRLVPESTSTSYTQTAQEPHSPIRMQLELLACRARVKEIEETCELKLAEVKDDAKAQVERLKKAVYSEMQRQIEEIKRAAEDQVERGMHQLQLQSENHLRIFQQLEKRVSQIDVQAKWYESQKRHHQESTMEVAADEIVRLRLLVETFRVEKEGLQEELAASRSSEESHCRRAHEALTALTRSRRANEEAVEELVLLRGHEAQHQKEKTLWMEHLSAAERAISVLRNDLHATQQEIVDQVVSRLESEIGAARKAANGDERTEVAQRGLEHIKGVISGAMSEAKSLEKSARLLLQQAREDQQRTQRALTQQVRRVAALEELRLKDCRELALLEKKLRDAEA